ncbi:MAG: ABC transporter ATP-binding protein [Desulfobacteraceae bacterium]|nr:MAG: ABC transporter ATP-binding protein [Desulfobacteraceae bacterium]
MLEVVLGKDIARYVKRHKGLVFLSLALTACASLLVVIPAYLLKPFVDEGMKLGSEMVTWKIPWIAFTGESWFSWKITEKVLVEGVSSNHLLVILTLVAFCSTLLISMTTYAGGLCAAAFSNRAVKDLRIDLYRKFVSLHLGYYHDKKAGDLIARSTADLTVMQGLIANVLMGLIEHPLTAMVFLTYLLIMNYKITLLVFFLGPALVGLVRLFGRKVKKHSTKVQDATADVTAKYHETLSCLRLILGFFTSKREAASFEALADNLYRKVMHWNRWNLGLGPMMDSAVFLVLPAVLIAGKVYFNHTLGELLSILYAFSKFYSPVKRLALVNTNLRTLQGATERVFGILETESAIPERPGAVELPRHRETICFNDVCFGYGKNDTVLKDISVKINAGEMAAFVGSTGAGKSTLLDLIPRFYDVTKGSITIDGTDIRDVTLASLRRQIGYVNQEVLLFHDTIANNIRYGNFEKGMEDVIAAAKAANAHEFILAQPHGYDTVVGDRGTMLSGGQRQRIAIARALFVNPTILILDEAASALDAESEKLVQQTIEGLRGRLTVLVVAHRLSTVMKSDKIYVIEGGSIVESGTREELCASGGRFSTLYALQFGPQN